MLMALSCDGTLQMIKMPSLRGKWLSMEYHPTHWHGPQTTSVSPDVTRRLSSTLPKEPFRNSLTTFETLQKKNSQQCVAVHPDKRYALAATTASESTVGVDAKIEGYGKLFVS